MRERRGKDDMQFRNQERFSVNVKQMDHVASFSVWEIKHETNMP